MSNDDTRKLLPELDDIHFIHEFFLWTRNAFLITRRMFSIVVVPVFNSRAFY